MDEFVASTFKYHVSCADAKISVRNYYYFTYFSTVVPSNSCVFLSCRSFVINTFSTVLVGVENVILTTKGLQERNPQLLDGTTVEK